MSFKDHYKTLGISPQATIPEIKQAYRQLAMIHHPDKNPGDAYAISRFNEIREAYEVLTTPQKKDIYLQQRWYDQSIGRGSRDMEITPVNLLRQSLDLERYVSRIDVHRMDHEGLFAYIQSMLSSEKIDKIKGFNEPDVERQIVSTLVQTMKPLKFSFACKLIPALKKFAGNDTIASGQIDVFLKKRKRNLFWEKYKLVVVVIVCILLCLLIFYTGK
jgi:curved DNA-binding protein CbpA